MGILTPLTLTLSLTLTQNTYLNPNTQHPLCPPITTHTTKTPNPNPMLGSDGQIDPIKLLGAMKTAGGDSSPEMAQMAQLMSMLGGVGETTGKAQAKLSLSQPLGLYVLSD